MDDFNPYAAPKAEVLTQDSEAEATRRKYINHESSIKSIGCLYWVVAIALVAVLITVGSSLVRESVWAVGLLAGLTLLAVAVGGGLRKLRRWAGILAALWSAILVVMGIISLPRSGIQMVISLYVLWLMISPKGLFVTSAEYRAIVAQTPHVKPRTSVVAWVLLVIFLLILASGVFSAMNG